jgi:hypothetical protein
MCLWKELFGRIIKFCPEERVLEILKEMRKENNSLFKKEAILELELLFSKKGFKECLYWVWEIEAEKMHGQSCNSAIHYFIF